MPLGTDLASAAPRGSRASAIVAACAVALAVALGVALRLADPLSSPVVPAEDPYTHMALVREHLRTGSLSPLDASGTLYPPGLHAFLAAAWVYTGSDLYGIILLGPVILGGIGILGMAILLWRTSGPTAGVVAALAMAVAPEAIFRSTMMSPTALDLAILPFLLYALLRVLAGRLGWIGVAAPTALFLTFAHPWLLAILCLAGVLFLLSALVFRWTATRGEPLTRAGVASCMAILGSALGLALLMPGFGGVLDVPRGTNLAWLGLGVVAISMAPALLLVRHRRTTGKALAPWPIRAPATLLVRLGSSFALAVALAATTALAMQAGMPAFVDLPRMVGWPILALAFAAIVALPFLASPVANLGASLFAATFPFAVFNPLHSEFLPHRTVVFLVVALCALAGVAAAALARAAAHAVHAFQARPTTANAARRPGARPLLFAAIPALLVSTLLVGAVYAGTPDSYPGGWYRLYNACELDALRDVARQADASPGTLVIVGDWQSKLVLAALASDAGRIWYKDDVFLSERARDDFVAAMQHNGRPVLVVLDRYLRTETPDANTSFTAEPPWQPAGSWCGGTALGQPRITAFLVPGRVQ